MSCCPPVIKIIMRDLLTFVPGIFSFPGAFIQTFVLTLAWFLQNSAWLKLIFKAAPKDYQNIIKSGRCVPMCFLSRNAPGWTTGLPVDWSRGCGSLTRILLWAPLTYLRSESHCCTVSFQLPTHAHTHKHTDAYNIDLVEYSFPNKRFRPNRALIPQLTYIKNLPFLKF